MELWLKWACTESIIAVWTEKQDRQSGFEIFGTLTHRGRLLFFFRELGSLPFTIFCRKEILGLKEFLVVIASFLQFLIIII